MSKNYETHFDSLQIPFLFYHICGETVKIESNIIKNQTFLHLLGNL